MGTDTPHMEDWCVCVCVCVERGREGWSTHGSFLGLLTKLLLRKQHRRFVRKIEL